MTDNDPNPSKAEPPARNHALDETIAPDNTDTASDGGFTTDAIPDSLGRYSIKKLLGRGGMGAVYLAHDSQLGRDIALKVPKFDSKANEKAITRFYREARSAANLSHPNLCQVFDVGEIDGTHYIAMAFIKGRPLSDYVNEGRPPNSRVAAGIVRKVAAGMHEAHQSGIIHRDIKPANIMIDHRNEPIVMDFGLAVAQENDTESRLTQDGALIGSPAYMAPEQLRGELDAIGPASDVYALGVVLFELLSGRLPFDGSGSTIAMIGQILTMPPAELSEIRKDLDPEIVKICNRAMSKDVANRYGTMKEFAAALTGYLKAKPDGSTAAGQNTSVEKAEPNQNTKTVTIAQIQINEKAKLAKTLYETKQFAAAIPILQQIVENPEAEGTKQLTFAKSALSKAKQHAAQQEQIKKQQAVQAAPSHTDDPFADLPDAPATAYRPPPRQKRKAAKSGGMNKGLLIGLGAVAVTGCIVVAASFFPSNPRPIAPLDTESGTAPVVAEDTLPTTSNSISTTARDSRPSDSGRAGAAPRTETRPNAPQQDGFRERPNRGSRLEQQLADFDKNGDGEIALDDVPAPARNLFRLADRNDDGILSAAEIDQMRRNAEQRGPGGPMRGPGERQSGDSPQRGEGPGGQRDFEPRGPGGGRDFGPNGGGGFDRGGGRPGNRRGEGPGDGPGRLRAE